MGTERYGKRLQSSSHWIQHLANDARGGAEVRQLRTGDSQAQWQSASRPEEEGNASGYDRGVGDGHHVLKGKFWGTMCIFSQL